MKLTAAGCFQNSTTTAQLSGVDRSGPRWFVCTVQLSTTTYWRLFCSRNTANAASSDTEMPCYTTTCVHDLDHATRHALHIGCLKMKRSHPVILTIPKRRSNLHFHVLEHETPSAMQNLSRALSSGMTMVALTESEARWTEFSGAHKLYIP